MSSPGRDTHCLVTSLRQKWSAAKVGGRRTEIGLDTPARGRELVTHREEDEVPESPGLTGVIEQGIAILDATSNAFAQRMTNASPILGLAPTGQFLVRLGTFGFLQCEAIATLNRTGARYTMQTAQLLRGLLEAWSTAAWLTEPKDASDQLRRALGFELSSLDQHTRKTDYQRDEVGSAVDPEHQGVLESRDRELAIRVAKSGVEPLPTVRKRMESLGRPDRYLMYRWECGPSHTSAVGLAQLVGSDDNGITVIGGPQDPVLRLLRVVTAWEVADDLFRICLEHLSLTDAGWYELAKEVQGEMRELMERAAPGSTIVGKHD